MYHLRYSPPVYSSEVRHARWQAKTYLAAIAEEASHEQNPERLLELTKELEEALDERDKLPPHPEPQKAKTRRESA